MFPEVREKKGFPILIWKITEQRVQGSIWNSAKLPPAKDSRPFCAVENEPGWYMRMLVAADRCTCLKSLEKLAPYFHLSYEEVLQAMCRGVLFIKSRHGHCLQFHAVSEALTPVSPSNQTA